MCFILFNSVQVKFLSGNNFLSSVDNCLSVISHFNNLLAKFGFDSTAFINDPSIHAVLNQTNLINESTIPHVH